MARVMTAASSSSAAARSPLEPSTSIPKSLPPRNAATAGMTETFTVASEQDCRDHLARDITALPERDENTKSQESSPTNSHVSIPPRRGEAPMDNTNTNVWITRTVRAAMAEILSGS